jgi:hypothetical protein
MQFMHALHPRNRFQIVLDIIDLDAERRRLQQNLAAALRQGDGGEQDHDGDPHTNSWIGVEALIRLDEPDDDGGNDDADIVDCIADDVNEHAEDTKIHSVLFGLRDDVHMGFVRGCEGRIFAIASGAVAVTVVVVMLVEEQGADEVEGQADAADD